jgi:hypothetical protein
VALSPGSAVTGFPPGISAVRNIADANAVKAKTDLVTALGSATQFQGNLMALTSITMVTGANILTGRALARNGALTLDTNQITPPSGTCTAASTTRTSTPTTPSTGAVAPGSALPGLGILATIVGGLMVLAGRRRPRLDGQSRRPPLG